MGGEKTTKKRLHAVSPIPFQGNRLRQMQGKTQTPPKAQQCSPPAGPAFASCHDKGRGGWFSSSSPGRSINQMGEREESTCRYLSKLASPFFSASVLPGNLREKSLPWNPVLIRNTRSSSEHPAQNPSSRRPKRKASCSLLSSHFPQPFPYEYMK